MVEAIEAGEANGHLSAVREAEADFRDRVSVNDALDEQGESTG